MTQKTISLSERAYKLLKREKKDKESFSKVIERLISKAENPWLVLEKQFDPEVWDGLLEKIRDMREENLTGFENND